MMIHTESLAIAEAIVAEAEFYGCLRHHSEGARFVSESDVADAEEGHLYANRDGYPRWQGGAHEPQW